MQTFLPYSSFKMSARSLDCKRLGKQRVEALQILQCLKRGGGWSNHPAVKMWRGYENALVEYGLAICYEWVRRGYKDTCFIKILSHYNHKKKDLYPPWRGSRKFHTSHRSNLIRKNPEHYKPMWPSVKNNLPYVWPITNTK